MPQILTGIGILCLLYFLVLMAKRVDFCIVWLMAAVFFTAVGGYGIYRAGHPRGFQIPTAILTAVGILAAVFLAVFVFVEARIVTQMLEKPQPDLDYVIVLGAQVKGKQPSLALRRRLEAARKYLEENPRTLAVLSGGQGDGEDITEARCMYEYLTENGIEEGRLLLEEASTTTEENLSFSAEIIAAHAAEAEEKSAAPALDEAENKWDPALGKAQRTGILSNNFHVYRASLLAKKMGYEHISTIAAPSDWRLQAHYLVREFFALIKEKITGNI